MRRTICVLSVGLVWAAGWARCQDAPLAFVHVNVIPMTQDTATFLPDHTVVVQAGRIAVMGPSSSTEVPPEASVVDATDRYLIPGLCDLHVHLNGGPKYAPLMLPLFIANGVTTVLNMDGNPGHLELREKVAKGELVGPTIYTAGPNLRFENQVPDYARGVKAVEDRRAAGYDFVKVYNDLNPEGYRGIMETAKRIGMPVVGHAVRSVGVEGALASGQHLAHMEEVIYGYFQDALDEEKIPDLARRMKESGIAVIATMVTYHHILMQVNDLTAMLASEGVEFVPEFFTRTWQPEKNHYLKDFTSIASKTRLQLEFKFQQQLLKVFHEAGVPILTGTDSPIPVVVPGFSLHQELQEFVDAGMSPYEALRSATARSADFLPGAHEFGRIQAGAKADLVLLEKNPVESIANSKTIQGVVARGKWLPRETLDEMLEQSRP